MAASTAFASLSIPVLDDSMELTSSPGANHADNDLDLDLDDYGGAQLTDDEHMMEDSQPTRPGTTNDDMMEDAEHMTGTPIVEEVMHDDPVNVTTYDYDEELIDYSDDEYQEDIHIVDEADATQGTENSFGAPTETVTEPEIESVDEELVRNPEEVAREAQEDLVPSMPPDTAPSTNEAAGEQQQCHLPPPVDTREAIDESTAGLSSANGLSAQEIADSEQSAAVVSDPTDLTGTTATAESDHGEDAPSAEEQQHDGNDGDENAQKTLSALDTSAYFTADGPPTPSDTGMHPMTVRYAHLEFPLFKSRSQPTGLLKDDNLASLSLSDLMRNCRQRLEHKIGESISTDQDLVLSVQNMGLCVSEVSPYASQTSLSEILDVYLQLHRNDGTMSIPPLALFLSLQLKFTSSLNVFKVAAEQGYGMSSFGFMQSQKDDDIESYYEGQAEDYAEEDGQEYSTGDDDQSEGGTAAQDFAEGEASQVEEGQEYAEEHEAGYADDPDYEGQNWDEHQADEQPATFNEEQRAGGEDDSDQAAYEPYEENDAQNLVDTNNISSGTQANPNDRVVEPSADLNVQPVDTAAEGNAADTQTEREAAEFNEPESATSSATIRDEATNDATEHHADEGEDGLAALASVLEEADEAATANVATDHDQHTSVSSVDHAGDEYSYDFGAQQEELIDYPDDDEEEQSYTATEPLANVGDEPVDNVDQQHEEHAAAEEHEKTDAVFELLEGHEQNNGSANGFVTNQTAADKFDFDEDRIDFDEDDDDIVQPQAVASASTCNSPLGKRSFDEHDKGNAASEQPDPKKARAG